MKKLRDWMHNEGRNIVIFMVVIVALGIAGHYFLVERDGYIGAGKPNPTISPKTGLETNTGGDRIGPVSSEATITTGDAMGVSPAPEKNAKKKTTEEAETENSVIRMGFAGDITLDDTSAVMRHMRKRGSLSKVIDVDLIEKMNAYDAMIINNEFSISEQGSPMAGKAYTFRSKPSNVKYLKKLGVDVAGLANNHIYDYGKEAFLDTLKYLKKAGIKTMGAGKNEKQAQKPVYLHIKGKTIALVAATRAEKNIMTPEAGKNSPGVFRTYDDTQYVKVIKKAKKKADYVVVYVHWGTEYSTNLESAQIEQAKDYVNAGADVIVGAHTHCMQGVGYYKDVPIFYSLGNFWFNERTLYTTVLEVEIDENGKISTRLQPCIQKGKETRLLRKKKQIKKFVNHINQISTNGRLNADCQVVQKKQAK